MNVGRNRVRIFGYPLSRSVISPSWTDHDLSSAVMTIVLHTILEKTDLLRKVVFP